ncbi:MAG: hypothetical protein BWZ10_00267 [candidate division BRC1 bacterium ADurb.BinA364]|nr:MAG: hypothetical protein BWZ10_00267 [candidate division BRC1 bacterium ADurb.BinA364]
MADRDADSSSPIAHRPSLSHIMPWPLLVAVFLALIGLTFLTVAATWIDLGALNLWIAMAIATAKASLVALFFMHLIYDRPFNSIVLIGALFFVMLFVSLALMDTIAYSPDMIPGYAPAVEAAP